MPWHSMDLNHPAGSPPPPPHCVLESPAMVGLQVHSDPSTSRHQVKGTRAGAPGTQTRCLGLLGASWGDLRAQRKWLHSSDLVYKWREGSIGRIQRMRRVRRRCLLE